MATNLHTESTVHKMAGDFLVYATHLTHTPKAHGSVIVRTNGAGVPIGCRYFRKGHESSKPIKPTWIPFSSTKSGEEPLSFSIRLMAGPRVVVEQAEEGDELLGTSETEEDAPWTLTPQSLMPSPSS
uniref:zona pellucida sperm-binding protein 3-like n=1 Tax=Pristiophorus japonicus TaxID=55135 RepID=UPI00398F4797